MASKPWSLVGWVLGKSRRAWRLAGCGVRVVAVGEVHAVFGTLAPRTVVARVLPAALHSPHRGKNEALRPSMRQVCTGDN